MAYEKEKMREYQNEWVKKRRMSFIAKMGPCYFCGTTENLEIHHVDPKKKESHRIWSWAPERINKELVGCITLCNECHIKYHALSRKRPPQHGTCYSYEQWKCRCKLCTAANNARKNKGAKYSEVVIKEQYPLPLKN